MAEQTILDQSTLKTQVYHYLRNQIISGDIPSGRRMVIPDIAEKLQVSLTPVREAISQLTVEKYVTTIPRKGTFVREVSFQEVYESYEVLGVLESYAAGQASLRISQAALDEIERLTNRLLDDSSIDLYMEDNWKIHELIVSETGNKVLQEITNRLREEITRYRYVSLTADKRLEESRKEHVRILETLKKRDQQGAARVMQEHREHTLEAMREYLDSNRMPTGKRTR